MIHHTNSRRVLFSLGLLGAVFFSAHEGHSIAAPRPTFGLPYTISTTGPSAPHVEGDQLVVLVSFEGRCGTRTFTPVYRRQTMGPIVWLTHALTPSADCPATTSQRVLIPLNETMRSVGYVWLFVPNGPNMQVRLR